MVRRLMEMASTADPRLVKLVIAYLQQAGTKPEAEERLRTALDKHDRDAIRAALKEMGLDGG